MGKGVELSTLRKGLEILGLFLKDTSLLDISSIAEQLGLSKSTAYKYVRTLEGAGFLAQNESGKFYQLGPRLIKIAAIARNPSWLVDLSHPVLQKLADQTNETALLAGLMGHWAVCLDKVEGNHALKMTYEVGATEPIYAGASAQVLLSGLDELTQKKLLDSIELRKFTERTVVSKRELLARIKKIRVDGFAISRGELDEGTFAVAAPIFSASGQILASLSIGGPLHRLDKKREKQYIKLVREGAREITRMLGNRERYDIEG